MWPMPNRDILTLYIFWKLVSIPLAWVLLRKLYGACCYSSIIAMLYWRICWFWVSSQCMEFWLCQDHISNPTWLLSQLFHCSLFECVLRSCILKSLLSWSTNPESIMIKGISKLNKISLVMISYFEFGMCYQFSLNNRHLIVNHIVGRQNNYLFFMFCVFLCTQAYEIWISF